MKDITECYFDKVLKCHNFEKLVKMSAIKQLICLIWVDISCTLVHYLFIFCCK